MTARETAIVTGAGRGIGRAIAGRLAGDGYRTILIDVDRDVAEQAAAELRSDGFEAQGHGLDIRDRTAACALIGALGPVHVLVNNAGIASDMVALADLTAERLRSMIDVNLRGTFVMAQEVLAVMRGGGRIINIASRGYLGGAGAAHYVASKAGVVGLTRAMAVELRWDDIRVNCVAPGMVDTRMIADFSADMRSKLERLEPGGGASQPEDIAHVVAFLASPHSALINGQVLMADGGKNLGIPPL